MEEQPRKNHCVGTLALLALVEAWEKKAYDLHGDAASHHYSEDDDRARELYGISEGLRLTASTLREVVEEIETAARREEAHDEDD